MSVKNEKVIMDASSPDEIFSMNPDTIEQEFEEYSEAYRPQAYSSIQNFIVMQKVTLLYRVAKDTFERGSSDYRYISNGQLKFSDEYGNHTYCYSYMADLKISKMFVTDRQIIFLTPFLYKKYHENYLEKTKKFSHLSKRNWRAIEPMLPNVVSTSQTANGDFVIIINKPCKNIYHLSEIKKTFDEYNTAECTLKARYVASILNKIYSLNTYLEIIGINYNAFTVDNLFFAWGRFVEGNEEFTIDDYRFVGAYCGWFYSTWADEKIKALPKKVYNKLTPREYTHGYSSFRLNAMCIRQLGLELLGVDVNENLEGIPKSMIKWLTDSECEKNAYEEFVAWRRVLKDSFPDRKFVDISEL